MQRPLTVNLEGDLRLCNHSPVIAGNIYKSSLDEILSSSYVKEWVTVKPDYCKDCDKFDQCLGGCRAAAEQVSGSLAFADPIIYNN